MKKALIYTLGNSDIKIEKNDTELSFGVRKKNFRKLTLEARKEIEKSTVKIISDRSDPTIKGLSYKDSYGIETKVMFPIFPLMLETLEKNEFTKIAEIEYFIFYTNQEDDNYNSQDTLHVAEMLKRFLIEIKVPEKSIHLEKINFNPTDTTKLLEKFDDFIKNWSSKLPEFETIFLASGPGTPQMAIASILSFTKLNNLQIYYIPRKGKPRRINILQRIKDLEVIEAVLNLISHYNYGSAYILYDKLSSEKEHLELLKSLYYRTLFEFEKAYNSIDDYFNKFDDEEIAELRKSLNELKNKNEDALIKELYYEFALKILSKQYMDAVGMVFRFQEEILKRAVEKYLNVKVIKGDKNNPNSEYFHDFREAIRKKPALQEHLENKGIDWEKRDPNRYVFKSVLTYALQDRSYLDSYNNEESAFRKIIEFDDDLEKKNTFGENLLDLRNSAPYAHGFNGVSKEKIEKILNLEPTDLIEKFRTLLSGIGINVERYRSEEFPFNKINKYIEKRLKKM